MIAVKKQSDCRDTVTLFANDLQQAKLPNTRTPSANHLGVRLFTVPIGILISIAKMSLIHWHLSITFARASEPSWPTLSSASLKLHSGSCANDVPRLVWPKCSPRASP